MMQPAAYSWRNKAERKIPEQPHSSSSTRQQQDLAASSIIFLLHAGIRSL